MKYRICIICEGYEETDYLNTLNNLGVFHKDYNLTIINAKGIARIYSRYYDKYASGSYHLVLVYCDTDKNYKELKTKINNIHNNKIADEIVFFANPCTMQIMLSHFDKVTLKKASKKINQDKIEKLTGIKNYDATETERKALMKEIKRSNYLKMKENLKDVSTSDFETPSTNFLSLLNHLENEDDTWIKEINEALIKSNDN